METHYAGIFPPPLSHEATVSARCCLGVIPVRALNGLCGRVLPDGGVSVSLSEAGNWAGFEVPTALDVIVHSNSVGVKRIRVDVDAEIDSLAVIGGGERSLVVDDGCTLVVRKGIVNRGSAGAPGVCRYSKRCRGRRCAVWARTAPPSSDP